MSSLKTIVFLGSYQDGTSREALRASKELGYYTVLLTDQKKIMQLKDDFSEVDAILFVTQLLDRHQVLATITDLVKDHKKICSCISFIDPYISYAASISAELGLPSFSVAALKKMEDKSIVREYLTDHSVTPFYKILPPNDDQLEPLTAHLPLVLKSPHSNGSKDVILVSKAKQLIAGVKRLRNKYPTESILVEKYVHGKQYLIEVLVFQGEISIVAIVEQEILNGDRFIITGYSFPALLSPTEHDCLVTTVKRLTEQFELMNGNCHFEMRLVDQEWKLIEINPRMSGSAMNKIILAGRGIHLVKEVLKVSVGEQPTLSSTKENCVYAKFLTVNTHGKLLKIVGEEGARAYDGVIDVYIKAKLGAIITKPLSMGKRYAYVIATAQTPEQAQAIATKAVKEIKFFIVPL